MRKETLCWECQNYSKCSWYNGKPVEGWEATPTKMRYVMRGKLYTVRSYCVHKCPLFVEDRLREVRVEDIAAMLHISTRTFYRLSRSDINARLKNLGYAMHIYDLHEEKPYYILEKLGGANERSESERERV